MKANTFIIICLSESNFKVVNHNHLIAFPLTTSKIFDYFLAA